MEEGPPVTLLTDWLASIPPVFQKTPVMAVEEKGGVKQRGEVDVSVVVSDLIFDNGGGFPGSDEVAYFRMRSTQQNRSLLGLILIISHILHHKWFREKKGLSKRIMKLLKNRKLAKLSKIVPPGEFISEPDRREELVRLILAELALIPSGETEDSARDRLTTLDSVERERVIKKTRKAQEKARKLREAMKKREAEEAASKWMRE